MVEVKTPDQKIQDFEKDYKNPKSEASQKAFDEVRDLLRTDKTFAPTLNTKINDNVGDNPMLKGFQVTGVDADGDIRFTDKDGNRFERDRDGNRREIWGSKEGGMEYTLNADGTATHSVKKGDTVWSVAESLLREKNKDKTPTEQEIQAESKRILAANKELKNPDLLIEGKTTLIIPKESVDEIKKVNSPIAKKEADNKENLDDVTKGGAFLNKEVFSKIDKNQDGYMDIDELNNYADERNVNGLTKDQREFIRELAAKKETIEDYNNDEWLWYESNGISEKDLSMWIEDRKKNLSKPVETPTPTPTPTPKSNNEPLPKVEKIPGD